MTTHHNTLPPSYLLLLPHTPWPVTREALTAAYATPLAHALKALKHETRKSTNGAVFDIAVSVPYLHINTTAPRRDLYATVQLLVSNLYRLVVLIAAKDGINISDSEGVDVRVLLIAAPRMKSRTDSIPDAGKDVELIGPVITLSALAKCERRWEWVFAVEGDEGEAVLHKYLVAQDGHVKIKRVPGGTIDVDEVGSEYLKPSDVVRDEEAEEDTAYDRQNHYSVAVGGTFDHLHIGHKLLLTMFAFVLDSSPSSSASDAETPQRTLTIGITGDELLKNKSYATLLESWNGRQKSAWSFLQSIMDFRPASSATVNINELDEPGPNGHCVHIRLSPTLCLNFAEISDPFGPTITEEGISALVVSGETRKGGAAVNERRAAKEWKELEVFEVDVLSTDDDANGEVDEEFKSKLSSTGIRKQLAEKAEERRSGNDKQSSEVKE
jgi:phosphopantetheine adenylyltransferase